MHSSDSVIDGEVRCLLLEDCWLMLVVVFLCCSAICSAVMDVICIGGLFGADTHNIFGMTGMWTERVTHWNESTKHSLSRP